MKYKVGQRVRIRDTHASTLPDYIVSGSMDGRFYDFLLSQILSIRNAVEDKKRGILYEFELPENLTCWVKEEALRGLKSKSKSNQVLGEVEQLDKIALNFREG